MQEGVSQDTPSLLFDAQHIVICNLPHLGMRLRTLTFRIVVQSTHTMSDSLKLRNRTLSR